MLLAQIRAALHLIVLPLLWLNWLLHNRLWVLYLSALPGAGDNSANDPANNAADHLLPGAAVTIVSARLGVGLWLNTDIIATNIIIANISSGILGECRACGHYCHQQSQACGFGYHHVLLSTLAA